MSEHVKGTALRFPVGTRVEVCISRESTIGRDPGIDMISVHNCNGGRWVPGTVAMHEYHQDGWCPTFYVAYMVKVDGDVDPRTGNILVSAVREDDDGCIRLIRGTATPPLPLPAATEELETAMADAAEDVSDAAAAKKREQNRKKRERQKAKKAADAKSEDDDVKPLVDFARELAGTGVPLAAPKPQSISKAFMTAGDLPAGLVDAASLRLARVYMDHDVPIKMGDGSPKNPPVAALACADAAELTRTFGEGAGTFMGEVLFWRRYRGQLLGKQKWACHSDEGPVGDTSKMSELWDMRWVFPSAAEARRFHADMLDASRAERGNGYLDGPNPGAPDLPGDCHECPDNFSAEVDKLLVRGVDALVLSSNRPQPLPKRGGLHSREVQCGAQTHYLQTHSAVFVVDRVVAKVFVASGINSRDARGRHVGVSPADFVQILCAAAESISRWLAQAAAAAGGGPATFDAFFEQLLRAGKITESQFDHVTDELASGLKTEAELIAEWADSAGCDAETDRRPKARSYGSLESEKMGGVTLTVSAGSKVRIAGLVGRKDLNGLIGTVTEVDPHSERVTVKVAPVSTSGTGPLQCETGKAPHELVRIRPSNLQPVFETKGGETQGQCPICMEVEMCTMVGDTQNATFMTCCQKPICLSCLFGIESGPLRDVCPFCRADTSDTSDEATVRGLRRGAERGDATAQYNLACHYDYGRMGLPLDQAKARSLYQLAAEQGHGRAAMNLAVSHRDGEGGPVDLKEAARWFKVAADLGHIQACTNVGIAYMRGDGVPQSRMEAIRYLTRGANAGDELAVMQLMRMGVQA